MGDLFYAQYTHDFLPSNKTAWGKCTTSHLISNPQQAHLTRLH